jgi:hypothetical protein
MTRYKIWTGPLGRFDVAEWIGNVAGFERISTGTEHVFFDGPDVHADTVIRLQDGFRAQGRKWQVRAPDVAVIR